LSPVDARKGNGTDDTGGRRVHSLRFEESFFVSGDGVECDSKGRQNARRGGGLQSLGHGWCGRARWFGRALFDCGLAPARPHFLIEFFYTRPYLLSKSLSGNAIAFCLDGCVIQVERCGFVGVVTLRSKCGFDFLNLLAVRGRCSL